MPQLKPMAEDEFGSYIQALIAGYAAERARNFDTSSEQELEESTRQVNDILRDGLKTPDQHVWVLVGDAGEPLGYLWVAVNEERKSAFIYDIEMKAEQRGKGYGRLALELLEAELRPMGIKRVALNVFGDNE